MKHGITSDGKWRWVGFFDKIYILKRRKNMKDIFQEIEPVEWRIWDE